jgi:hypothetical protein
MLQPAGAKEATGQPDGTLKGSGASMAAAAWQRQLDGGDSSHRHATKLPPHAAAVAGGDKDTDSDSNGGGTDNNHRWQR